MFLRKKPVLTAIILFLAAAILLCVYLLSAQKPIDGEKSINLLIVHGDGSQSTRSITTSAGYLGEALEEQSLIEGVEGAFGLFIKSVDGELANEEKQQWWCITKDGEQLMSGVDSTPLEDGDNYELTLMTGY